MAKWDFWGKRNTNWFDKNPDKAWRPRKGIALVNHELAEKGYTPATKNDIETNYMSMISLEKEELEKLAVDYTKPMLINILADNLLKKNWFEIAEKILDRGIWKAKQTEESIATVKIESSKDIEWKNLEELKAMISQFTK